MNISTEVSKDGILIIKCDLNKSLGQSKSGKSIVIGTTSGNIAVPGPKGIVKVGVNIYREPTAADKATLSPLGI